MTRFYPKKGQRVVVSPKAKTKEVVVKYSIGSEGCFKGEDDNEYHLDKYCTLSLTKPGTLWEILSVTDIDPYNWPPCEGDVWKAAGIEYHILALAAYPAGKGLHQYLPFEDLKRLNPELRYRSGRGPITGK